MIEIKLYRDKSVLDGNPAEIKEVAKFLYDNLSYTPKNAHQVDNQIRNKLQAKNVPKHAIKAILAKIDHTNRLFNKDSMEFPSGLVYRVLRMIVNHSIQVKIKSYIEEPERRSRFGIPPKFEPREHQVDSVQTIYDHLGEFHTAVSRMATGAGKTFAACMLIAKLGVSKTMFIVPSQLLLEQAYEDFVFFFGSDMVGRMGAGYHEPGAPITIVTFQSLTRAFAAVKPKKKPKKGAKKPKEESLPSVEALERVAAVKETDLVIPDEVHHLPAESYYEVIKEFTNAAYVCGYTATDRRGDGGHIMIEAASGFTAHSVLPPELIDAGYIMPPMIYFRPIPMRAVPTFFHEEQRIRFFTDYQNYSKHQIIDNDEMCDLVAKDAMKAADSGKHVLVAINRIEHGKLINQFIRNVYDRHVVTSQTKGAWKLIKEFRKGFYPILISTLCSEGFNAPNIDSLIIAQDTTDSEQIVGRGLRTYPGKTVCRVDHVYHTIPNNGEFNQARYLTRHAWECREIYVENQYPIIKDMEDEYVAKSWR